MNTTPKTVVIYHRADFDGLFCGEIAKKFLSHEGIEYIGWDHGACGFRVKNLSQIGLVTA